MRRPDSPHPVFLGALVGVALCCALLAPGPSAHAGAVTEARTAAEIYERKPHLRDCLAYVASDLKARWEKDPAQPPAELLLVVDPSASMKDEIEAMRKLLPEVWAAGPPGLRIGAYGVGTGMWQAPSRVPNDADGQLASLAFLPMDGPKNLLAGVREAAARLGRTDGGPKALLVVSQEFDGGEDDVEATRDALVECAAAFYSICAEAGFERPWLQEFEARDLPAAGLSERYNPLPRRHVDGALYYGSEVPFGLVPYRFEFDLAQNDFVWVRPPRYPVPSGFGFWCLATLSYSSGGRCFVYDFTLPAEHPRRDEPSDPEQAKRWRAARRKTEYDFSRLALLAPDLRPRKKVLRSLAKDWRAHAIVRIWSHLANDALPVLQRIGVLERRGSSLVSRPKRPVRSSSAPLTWFEDLDDVRKARRAIEDRVEAVETAIKWWESANGKQRKTQPGEDPLAERVEADFQLLGVQLRRVRFHLGEAIAALDAIKPLDVTYRRARILPQGMHYGVGMPRKRLDLEDEERNARLAAVLLAQRRLAQKYPDTPWSAILAKERLMTFRKDVRIIPTEPDPRERRPDKRGEGKKKPPRPTPPAAPKPPPPPGPRPGSGGSGPVTGK